MVLYSTKNFLELIPMPSGHFPDHTLTLRSLAFAQFLCPSNHLPLMRTLSLSACLHRPQRWLAVRPDCFGSDYWLRVGGAQQDSQLGAGCVGVGRVSFSFAFAPFLPPFLSAFCAKKLFPATKPPFFYIFFEQHISPRVFPTKFNIFKIRKTLLTILKHFVLIFFIFLVEKNSLKFA